METIIISLGGSLIIPNEIDVDFLKVFRKLIISEVKKEKRFVIITGGGSICRKYNEVAMQISKPTNNDLDWIGIASLRLNAELLRVVFGEYAHAKVVKNLSENFSFNKPIVIGSAYKPGHSSDWNAILVAKKIKAKRVINLTNIDFAYDKDPNKFKDAKKIERIKWQEYRKLIPKEWTPGIHTPFDPIASRMAEKERIEVVIMNGRRIDNFTKYLLGKNFSGTTIF